MHSNIHWENFREWLNSNLGKDLIQEESLLIENLISTLFGFYLVFLGEYAFLQCVQKSPILNKIWAHPAAIKEKNCSSVRTRQDRLPFILNQIDLIYLPHSMEFGINPHEVLREAYSILKSEGHIIITGFNPWSLWGFWRLLVRYIRPVPWDARYISLGRLKDWLALLGFDVLQVQTCFFCPPFENTKWLSKIKWFEKLGKFLFPLFGASYVVLAKKQVISLTPIRPAFAKQKQLRTGLIEPVTRSRTLD